MNSDNVKITYCKYCGGEINQYKKCSKCGKQYFTLRSPKTLLLLLLLAVSSALYLASALYSTNTEYVALQKEYNTLQNAYKALENAYFSALDNAESYDNNQIGNLPLFPPDGVLVMKNGSYYHKNTCDKIQNASDAIFYENAEACEKAGYSKCPYCFE